MSIIGITRVRDEVDIVEFSLRRMLTQVDTIIVGENFSEDGTREAIEDLIREGSPIILHDDSAKNFEQRDVMNAYAREAAEMGATWVVPFDMDEIWMARDGRLGDFLLDLPEAVMLAPAQLYTHAATDEDNTDDPDPFSRMEWRSIETLPLAKVACRCRPDLLIAHGNHSANYDLSDPGIVNWVLTARHYPYRTPEQFIKRVKIAWPMLRESGLPEGHGQHMRVYGRLYDERGEEGLEEWFRERMFFPNPRQWETEGPPGDTIAPSGLVHDPCPVTLPLLSPG